MANLKPVLLNKSHWFRLSSGGKLQIIRRCAADEAHFPKELRRIYQADGEGNAVKLIKYLREQQTLGLAAAWAECQRLFNEAPSLKERK